MATKPSHMKISEDLLHYVWKYKLYNTTCFFSQSGQALQIHSPGIHNMHAGPDFEDARLVIGDTLWAGNVEIHIRSSDWRRHNHQHDVAYNNVILHVVYEFDEEIALQDGTVPQTLELKPLIREEVMHNYFSVMKNLNWPPCEGHIKRIDAFSITQWLARIGMERLENKANPVQQLLGRVKGSWEELTYILLARNFGFKVNAQPFEQLAQNTPYKLLLKHKDNPQVIEALIFGQAGMLEEIDFKDPYPSMLRQKYLLLKRQHRLRPLPCSSWKFLKMRPLNFPTIRLAQFAAWCVAGAHLFSSILHGNVEELRQLFGSLPVHAYWFDHYRFDVESKKHTAKLGDASIDNILLNTVAIILFSYGKYLGKEPYIYRAIDLLEQLRAEQNYVVKKYLDAGIRTETALASQALLQLKSEYCDKRRCLDCGIGLQIFKQNIKL